MERHSKTLFRNKTNRFALHNLESKPVIIENESVMNFTSRDKTGPILSLHLNKPSSEQFGFFVNSLIEKIISLNKSATGEASTIKAYSQRLTPPFSGLVQIAESNRARALTMDGKNWEFQYRHMMLSSELGPGKQYRHRFSHALTVDQSGLKDIVTRASSDDIDLDESLIELAVFISEADFPFPSTDIYEYWLLDKEDDSPLAMIFSCSEPEQMSTFPDKTEWTALPAAAMPIELTTTEKEQKEIPVNRRVEQMVAERAGFYKPKARWFKRHPEETTSFPPLLVTEEWENKDQEDLCQRYLKRQSSRLLLLHNLPDKERQRLEISAKSNALEVERFYPFYPKVIDQKLMTALLVEARLRKNIPENSPSSVENRRDGILYL